MNKNIECLGQKSINKFWDIKTKWKIKAIICLIAGDSEENLTQNQ
jgi:hypothetical protein